MQPITIATPPILITAILVTWANQSAGGQIPAYTFAELPAPPGMHSPQFTGINPSGTVIAGTAVVDGTTLTAAVAWIDGEPVVIADPGPWGAYATAANDAGVVVGRVTDNWPEQAFAWSDGVISHLSGWYAVVRAVNGDGVIAGTVGLTTRAVRWIGGQHEFLLPADIVSHAFDVNDAGTIIGLWREGVGSWRGFVWENGQWGTLPWLSGGSGSRPNAINSHGLIAGISHADFPLAVVWENGELVPLFDGQSFSVAYDLNDEGDVVGTASFGGGHPPTMRAVIWSATPEYQQRYLHEFVVNLPPGWALESARGISNSGSIIGVATASGEERAFLLTPVPPDNPADLNGDGVVDVLDLLILLDAWGECKDCKDCPADLNGDCSVDVLDLLILLDNWG